MDFNKYSSSERKDSYPVRRSYSIMFNSDPRISSALNADGFNNRFRTVLNSGLGAPANAKTCRIALTQANVWNYDENLREPNTRLYFEYDGNPQAFITLPSGYYGLAEFNDQVSLQLNLGGYPTDLFNFSGDTTQQKVVVTFNYANSRLDFTPADSLQVRSILGFNARLSPLAGPAGVGDVDVADNIAKFNSVNNFLLRMPTLLKDGIPVGAVGSSILASIPVTSPPNSLITYTPAFPSWIDCMHLIGSDITDILFELTNELLEPVAVLDSYNFILTVEWDE